MISKNTIKLVRSLSIKKYREKEKLFLIEGDKMVAEIINSNIKIKELLITEKFSLTPFDNSPGIEKISVVEKSDLKKISLLQSPQNSLAICRMPEKKPLPEHLNTGLSLFLDSIQDPGNLGTIVRICDWFGISRVFCSKETVDLYNPKVIQASMGSFHRVSVWESSFSEISKLAQKNNVPTYGAFMGGKNVYGEQLPEHAILVMGNEGNGISTEVEKQLDRKISIPNLSANSQKAESLNVSVATAILCSEFKRG